MEGRLAGLLGTAGRVCANGFGIGRAPCVTQAIGRLKRKGQPKLERLKRRLEQVYENHNGEVEV
jgi:hypothetical protein